MPYKNFEYSFGSNPVSTMIINQIRREFIGIYNNIRIPHDVAYGSSCGSGYDHEVGWFGLFFMLDKCLVCQVKHRLAHLIWERLSTAIKRRFQVVLQVCNILANPSVRRYFHEHINRIRICHKFVHVTEIHMYVNQEKKTILDVVIALFAIQLQFDLLAVFKNRKSCNARKWMMLPFAFTAVTNNTRPIAFKRLR